MPNQAYFPASEADRIVWLSNYQLKLPVQGAACGIAATEISTTQADIIFYIWLLQTWYPAMQQEAIGATEYKAIIAMGNGAAKIPLPTLPTFSNPPATSYPGVLNRIFNQVARIKLSPAYTDSIGKDLGIVGMMDTAEHLVPHLTASVEQGVSDRHIGSILGSA